MAEERIRPLQHRMGMSLSSKPHDPTANYRPYPKGPNFGLIVALACIAMLLLFVVALFVLHGDRKLLPHRADPHPTSSLTTPATAQQA